MIWLIQLVVSMVFLAVGCQNYRNYKKVRQERDFWRLKAMRHRKFLSESCSERWESYKLIDAIELQEETPEGATISVIPSEVPTLDVTDPYKSKFISHSTIDKTTLAGSTIITLHLTEEGRKGLSTDGATILPGKKP
jgi:hypothetical protein